MSKFEVEKRRRQLPLHQSLDSILSPGDAELIVPLKENCESTALLGQNDVVRDGSCGGLVMCYVQILAVVVLTTCKILNSLPICLTFGCNFSFSILSFLRCTKKIQSNPFSPAFVIKHCWLLCTLYRFVNWYRMMRSVLALTAFGD